MSFPDYMILVVGGLIGWGVVSGLIYLIRQQRKPPVEMDPTRPVSPQSGTEDRPRV